MNALQSALIAANIKRAVIVDDAYDSTPLASDLVDTGMWTQFFDDLGPKDRSQIEEVFPAFKNKRADQLKNNDDFVISLWNIREKLRPELASALFDTYNVGKKNDLDYLTVLSGALHDAGLECQTTGRAFQSVAADADLIIIDLFLGANQDENDIQASIKGLEKVINNRRHRPPLVVLMSRSNRLEAKRAQFRDDSGLFESTFRIISKAELREPGRLSRLLTRLAVHYPDAVKLAAFHDAWQDSLRNACQRTCGLFRTLDIADHAQIRQLLLNAEQEPLGSYLVDVFDRVLQHEVEGEKAIIDAAKELNTLQDDKYPPPYVAGSPDLQLLVYRSIFQNSERLRLTQALCSRVAFGDVLRREPPFSLTTGSEQASGTATGRLAHIGSDHVLAVLTPACDLQRSGAKGVLLLVGTLSDLQPAYWSYADNPVRTPIIQFQDGKRYWIKWNLKHIETISPSELAPLLDAPDGFRVVGRFRESHALELQQKLLSSLGRVGLLASMPATFPIKVELYLAAPDRTLLRLDVPSLSQNGAVRFVGRGGDKDAGMRLVICEDDCEAIFRAFSKVELNTIHPDVRELVRRLQTGEDLLFLLEKGIVLPRPGQEGFKEIFARLTNDQSTTIEQAIGLIGPESLTSRELKSGDVRKAGIVIGTGDFS